ncbi:M81 family peptidase [Hwanghaeella grinnelliae]|uniref:Microcystinase C n=1 Tax=Hwanghaeella grinnelliae TaxID=2500179 RepID=A0A3S2WRY8_9PROT|nr:M81 family metallopeptidase [Hwanghaeella grinnelliae]RVU36463.1 M81 family peptidase [Hwanghaeella grinnelliae]
MAHRILIAKFAHETNRFSDRPTGLDAFRANMLYAGSEIPARLRDTNSEIAGFLDVTDIEGWTIIPTIAANAGPSGMVTAEAEKFVTDRILADLSNALENGPIDGVLLALHGAMVTETADDGEGALLAKLREKLGPDIPIMATLDLHANVTDRMAELATALFSYRTYPHVDMRERGVEAAQLMARCLAGDCHPVTVVSRAPLLVGCDDGRTTNAGGQMLDHLAAARKLEGEEPGVLTVSVNAGFVDADIEQAGPSVTVTGDGASKKWRQLADEIMAEIWRRRDESSIDILTPEVAVERAMRANRPTGNGPVVIADFADNPGAGAYGDATGLLDVMLKAGLRNTAFGGLYDPGAAAEMHRAGVGAVMTIPLGGKTNADRGGGPLTLTGTVTALGDGSFVYEGPMSTGVTGDLGPCGCFRVETKDGADIDILVTSNNLQMLDRALFRAVGIQPEKKRVLAVKSQQHFRGAFGPIASEIMVCDTGAMSSDDLSFRTFKHVRRPIHPLDLVVWEG